MSNLADRIERHLKRILDDSQQGYIILRRGMLAAEFSCVPSQINYVLSTRFTVERGYLVESRRGGGGYLRIVRLGSTTDRQLHQAMRELIGEQISQERAYNLIERLLNDKLVTIREAEILRCVLSRESLGGETLQRDILRARLLKNTFIILCREDLA
ncbi:MAG: CtsR family transcriptional regulator [Peptococcaceae bacterium]|jgi:transcriptional regulator CtsR|nr:CtsR family transcriptional regulator [Peptococcaceae bacterium]